MDCPYLSLPGDNCTGCSVCANICPVDAIRMAPREMDDRVNRGFLYPRIDGTLCISCGKCVDRCPVANPHPLETSEQSAYSARCDPYRMNCTSGGVFGALSTYFIRNHGKVAGAELLPSLDAREVLIDTEDGILPLCKSKYVQSHAGSIYSQIKDALEEGSKVLFCSTPCQIAGIRSFLGREYENLYTIDLICHGVCNSDLLRRILAEEYPGETVTSVEFRSKKKGWGPMLMAVTFGNGSTRYLAPKTSTFSNCFLGRNLALRPSCFSCPYANMSRYGDITIGDHWTIDPADNDRKGTSIVIANNGKGLRLLDILAECGASIGDVSIPSLFGRHHNLQSPTARSKSYGAFHKLAEYRTVRESVNCTGNRRDVAIAVMVSKNYGNNLTNWALFNTVRKLGYSAVIIPRERLKPASIFGNSPYDQADVFTGDANICGSMAKVFVVGSDQVFARHNILKDDMFSILPWVGSDRYMFSYSSSFGQDVFDVDEETRSRIGFYLGRFDAVSLRELSGPSLVQSKFGIDAVQMPDPVFLPTREEYTALADRSKVELPDEPFIGVYMLVVTEKSINQVRKVASDYGIDRIIYIGNSGKASIDADGFAPLVDATVEDFLNLIDKCTVFLTDSFHGSCFSLILGRQFYLLKGSETRSPDRINSLIEMFGLPNLRLSSGEGLVRIDFAAVQTIMDSERERGTAWLRDQIEKGLGSCKVSDQYDIMMERNSALERKIANQNKMFRYILAGDMERSFECYLESETVHGLLGLAKSLLEGIPDESDLERAARCYEAAVRKDTGSLRYVIRAMDAVPDRAFAFRMYRILNAFADSPDPEIKRLLGLARSRRTGTDAKK